MIYSNSLENYCKNPMCSSTISEIESKLATIKSNYRNFMGWYIGAWGSISAVLVTFFVMEKGLSGLFILLPVIMFATLIWTITWEYYYDSEKQILVKIMGNNYSCKEKFMEVVKTPDIDHIASPLGRQLIESITKQDRQMRKFELTLIESLCKF